ncbi:hypothetical protein VNI00_009989 [Paramarasmius palmivorus]|uniref:Uncharacterized protein n=1 Tax=Paramarasmius palmivorus TaxID=297713 RepID=A0AAW0CMP2_9AGAR
MQYETVTLGSPLYNRNIIRSVFINRICRSLALFGYNFRNNQVRQAIFYTLTSLRYCNPPPPPSAPWTWYAYAEDWNAIARLARNSIRATSMDEMIHLLHTSKLCGTPPNFPSVRYIVYTRLDELPTLLRAEKPAPPKPVTLPASVDNEADIVEPAENRAEDHLIDDAAPAVPTDSADDNPHVMSAEEKEQEERILARIPEIYRKNHARTQAARTRTEERRDDYFLSCREAARSCNLPGGVYLKMMLGPLPHVLMTLQALYDLTQEFKRKTKDWMKGELSHEQLDMLDQQLTQTNSAIKSITALQKNLGSKSPIHSEQRDSLLKKYVGETRVLIAEGLPFALPEDVHREFNIGWKGIVKPKAPKKPAKSEERPTLNTSDLDELDFE